MKHGYSMSLYGQWLLDETSGTSLADGSPNSNTGSTDGTPSGALGVFLTESQTIDLPVQLSSETSISIFLFVRATTSPVSERTIVSNSSGDASESLTIGLDPSGVPYVTHLGNTISGEVPIGTTETHLGFVYDHGYNIQYLYINGTITSTLYGTVDTSSISNNSNTITLGAVFSGYIRGVHMYSGVVQSNIPEGLAKETDPSLIIPSGTVYASRVEESGDVVHGGIIFNNEHLTSSLLKANKAHYVHDEILNEVYQTSSTQHRSDATGKQSGYINLRVRNSTEMHTRVDTSPGETKIGYGDSVATIDVSGLRFNSESAGLHFGENQEFRIVMTSDTPPRLRFQSYDSSTGQYVTKYSVVN